MTFKEFKSWLDGFTDSWREDYSPSQAQWKRIKEKLDGVVVQELQLLPSSPFTTPLPFNPSVPLINPVQPPIFNPEINKVWCHSTKSYVSGAMGIINGECH
jgi:hypothetical protein